MEHRRVFGYVPPVGSNERTRLLRLKVVAGHNLAKKDIFGASDPYIRMDLIDRNDEVEDTVVTKTKKRTLNPKWCEEFVFRVKPEEHKLVLEVFDENRLTRDDFLGMVELPLANMPREAENRQIPKKYYILRPRSARSKVRGHLELYHAFVPASGDEDESDNDGVNIIGVGGDSVTPVVGDWEVVATSIAPSSSIDGAETSSNEPFVVNSSTEEPVAAAAADDAVPQEPSSSTVPSAGGGGMDVTPTLPAGWEERQDANGRTYYVNHVTRTTQWHHPGTIAGVGEGGVAAAEETYAGRRRRVHISVDDNVSSRRESRVMSYDSDMESISSQANNVSIGDAAAPASPPAAAAAAADQTDAAPDAETAAEGASGGSDAGASSSSRGQRGGAGAGNAASEGLPGGWTLQVAPNGRVFFINHSEKKTTWVDPRTGRPSQLPSQANVPNRKHEDDLGPLPEGWEERVHTDGRIFFIDHNTRATQWEDPRISDPGIAGPAIPYNRDYKRKYEFLKTQLKKPHNVPNKLEIKIRRSAILEDSFRQIIAVSAAKVDVLKTKLWIEFDGEIGLDYGGVAREWFYLLSKEMFNPYYGLFEYSATDNYTLQINPNSGVCSDDHLSYFKFIGRVAGMAVYHGRLLDGFFIRPFYKMMLGKPIELKDMESVDTEYFNSMMWIKENDPTELELTFQVDEENFGKTVSRDLKPYGGRCPVTNENKNEYIQLVISWRFVSRIQSQMDSFLAGFKELVPLNLLKIFDEGELELLMCGIGAIDVKDWKQYTVYKGDYHHNHIVIQWFWRVVLSFNNEMRSRLLQFVTGTSRVPMNGFKELYGSNGPQPFTIEKWGTPNNFPRAHTCFNRLDLPLYESYQQLKDRLIRAIEGSEGFAGVD